MIVCSEATQYPDLLAKGVYMVHHGIVNPFNLRQLMRQ